MTKPISDMAPEELRALTPEQLAHRIITDNFDTGQLARGTYMNLTKDIQDCLLAYGDYCAREQAERDAAYLEERAVGICGNPANVATWIAAMYRDEAQAIRARLA